MLIMVPKLEIRHFPAYLMLIAITLIILALIFKSWAFIWPVIIIQIIITSIDPDLFLKKQQIIGFIVYSFIEVISSLFIFGIVTAFKMVF